jgi:hypothetical protein
MPGSEWKASIFMQHFTRLSWLLGLSVRGNAVFTSVLPTLVGITELGFAITDSLFYFRVPLKPLLKPLLLPL